MDEGPAYNWAARVSAEIINLHLHSTECKAMVFGRILFAVLTAITEAHRELNDEFLTPSEN